MVEYMNLNGARVFLGKIRGEFLTKSTAASTYLTKTATAEGALKDGNGDTISVTYLKKTDFEEALAPTFKAATFSNNTVNFYTSSDTAGTPAFTFSNAYSSADNSITISNSTVAVKRSQAANNSITLQNDGLHVDISGKLDTSVASDTFLSKTDAANTYAKKSEISTTPNSDLKNYVRTINAVSDGIEFLDGNSNVIFKIPVMS